MTQHTEVVNMSHLEAAVRQPSLNESFLDVMHQVVHDNLVTSLVLLLVLRWAYETNISRVFLARPS